jgi:hypothetical protein
MFHDYDISMMAAPAARSDERVANIGTSEIYRVF